MMRSKNRGPARHCVVAVSAPLQVRLSSWIRAVTKVFGGAETALMPQDWHSSVTKDCANQKRSCKPNECQGLQERLFLAERGGFEPP